MIEQLIIENPNDDWKDLSAWEFPQLWTKDTFIPLRNRERYYQAFSKTPHKFNFLITEYQKARNDKEYGQTISRPDSINVILTNNVGSVDVVPFTPWILAHRIGHAIQVTNRYSFETEILYLLQTLIEYGFKIKIGRSVIDNKIDEFFTCEYKEPGFRQPKSQKFNFLELVSLFIDTQCSRNNRIVNVLDIFSELVAEYLIKGRVTLRQPTAGRMELTGTTTVPGQANRRETFSWVYHKMPDERMETINFKINWLMRGQFERLVGKVITF